MRWMGHRLRLAPGGIRRSALEVLSQGQRVVAVVAVVAVVTQRASGARAVLAGPVALTRPVVLAGRLRGAAWEGGTRTARATRTSSASRTPGNASVQKAPSEKTVSPAAARLARAIRNQALACAPAVGTGRTAPVVTRLQAR